MSLLAAFAILLVRALLPGAVMLDPVSASEGGFALVICSGHGPMFAHEHGMDMSHMAGMSRADMDMSGTSSTSGPPAHDSTMTDDGMCPFSAALFAACIGVVLAVLLFVSTRITQSWSTVPTRTRARPSPYCRPQTRAPPLFS